MAEPNEIADGDKTVAPETKSELPRVESPPLSPAENEKLPEPVLDSQMKPQQALPPAPTAEVKATDAPKQQARPQIKLPPLSMPTIKIPEVKLPAPLISRRTRRRAALAATVMLAAGFGAAVGAIANRAPASLPPQRDAALIGENHALQRSIAKLTKDLSTLKANVESSARESKTQLAKATEKLNDRIDRAVEVTGSIGKPATTAPAPAIAEKAEPAPIPTPRPAIVQGWTVREARNGRVFVENRGELFLAAPGVPLPGLGRVEAIRREGDSLVVVTSKGLITENRSSAAIRPRPQYFPPPWRPY
jgi:hypothetical protein